MLIQGVSNFCCNDLFEVLSLVCVPAFAVVWPTVKFPDREAGFRSLAGQRLRLGGREGGVEDRDLQV